MSNCPKCGTMLNYNQQYGMWFCPKCNEFQPGEAPVQPSYQQPPPQQPSYQAPPQPAYQQAQQPSPQYQAPQQYPDSQPPAQPYQQPPTRQPAYQTQQQSYPAPPQQYAPAPQQYGQPPQQQYEAQPQQPKRQSWLVSKLPFVVGLVVGIVLGWVHPLLGVFGAVAASIGVGQALEPKRKLGPNPKNAARFWSGIINIVGGILVVLTFTMRVSDAGLGIPPFYNPKTFVNYFSVLVLVPDSIGSTSAWSAFPGFPALVIPAAIMVFLGLFLPESWLQRRIKLMLQVMGMALLTLAPVISYAALGSLDNMLYDYGLFFWIGWVGIALQFLSMFLPKLMEKGQPAMAMAFVGFLPLVAFAGAAISAALAEGSHGGALFRDWESDHHNLAGIFAGLLGGLAGAGADGELEQSRNVLELTYPAGRSPNVFTTGWLFGAKCIVDAGTEKERDLSDSVQWSGSGGFNPGFGRTARPSFNGPGYNKIIITCDTGEKVLRKIYGIRVISPDGYANTGSAVMCPGDAHGCPACPHPTVGMGFTSFSPTVLVNGKPAIRVGDTGIHAACCGANTFQVVTGVHLVTIDGRRAAKVGDMTQHCGGTGMIKSQG